MPGNELVQSLARGLDLVRLLAEADGSLSLPEIVAATGLKRPTVHNLLRTLVSREFVTKADGNYRLGPAVYLLAAADESGELLRRAEEQVLVLAERFPAAIISFSESIGGKVLARFHKYPHRVTLDRKAGMEMRPYQTASGLAVLAFADPETRQSLQMYHPFQVEGISLWENEENLERFLGEVREKGYVFPPFCDASNYKLAALPVISPHGRILGVFGVAWHLPGRAPTEISGRSGPNFGPGTEGVEYDADEIVSAMRSAAERLQSVENEVSTE